MLSVAVVIPREVLEDTAADYRAQLKKIDEEIDFCRNNTVYLEAISVIRCFPKKEKLPFECRWGHFEARSAVRGFEEEVLQLHSKSVDIKRKLRRVMKDLEFSYLD